MSTERDLIFAAARLQRNDNELWSAFVAAFTAYSNTQRDNCIQSPLDVLPVAQGRAQACAQLTKLLANPSEQADRIQDRRKP